MKVLIVEDDLELREAVVDTLKLKRFAVESAGSGEEAIVKLKQTSCDFIVSDVNMPGMSGHDLLEYVRQNFPHIPMLLVTAYAAVEKAVEAMQKGAVDYLVKPFSPVQLVELIEQHGPMSVKKADEPVAVDSSSQKLLKLARKVANTDSTILISGESGTGKEVLAKYIHQHSDRCDGPFVAINCAAIPENMLEATLFGHEKGAFTGAISSQVGKFEQANGGTILLDEISEMDISLQAKLLRVLQEREVERIGGRKTIELDVRVLATTNRSLAEEVRSGQFREDLYYRLSVFPLQWQPLRQRKSDILPIAESLLKKYGKKMQKPILAFDASAKSALLEHGWPGNIRELDNAIQRALILQSGQFITEQDLGISLDQKIDFEQGINQPEPQALSVNVADKSFETVATKEGIQVGVKHHEFEMILDALRIHNGRKNKAADYLGISSRTLRYKLARMRELGMDVDDAIASIRF